MSVKSVENSQISLSLVLAGRLSKDLSPLSC